LEGTPISPRRAHSIGLCSELAPAGEALPRAEARARSLMEKPPQAFAAVKRLFQQTLVPASGKELQSLETFVQHWSSAESTECRKQLAASLRR